MKMVVSMLGKGPVVAVEEEKLWSVVVAAVAAAVASEKRKMPIVPADKEEADVGAVDVEHWLIAPEEQKLNVAVEKKLQAVLAAAVDDQNMDRHVAPADEKLVDAVAVVVEDGVSTSVAPEEQRLFAAVEEGDLVFAVAVEKMERPPVAVELGDAVVVVFAEHQHPPLVALEKESFLVVRLISVPPLSPRKLIVSSSHSSPSP
jgi:hypothetical protein